MTPRKCIEWPWAFALLLLLSAAAVFLSRSMHGPAEGEGNGRSFDILKMAPAERAACIEKFKARRQQLVDSLFSAVLNEDASSEDRAWSADQLADIAANGIVSRAIEHLDTRIVIRPLMVDNPGDLARETPFVHIVQSQGRGLSVTAIEQMGRLDPESETVRHWADILSVHMPDGLARMAVSAWIEQHYAGKRFSPSPALLRLRDLLPPH